MPVEGDYAPSPSEWVRDQVDLYESSGGTDGTMLRGMPVVVMTMQGKRSGKVRKVPVMRVEHGGVYAAVASKGGAPEHPLWYWNLAANPRIELQDGTLRKEASARQVHGEERAQWWARAVEAYPDYADYQTRTDREIPVFVLE
ncbi:MAG TPA: nitroreductase family deazaflavin-dependent oxidoreductase [Rugosimonospora sp.]|nr:nitroreductase family deazaflavin-dependent oxidoreductase [Rugosimonospora sp.]